MSTKLIALLASAAAGLNIEPPQMSVAYGAVSIDDWNTITDAATAWLEEQSVFKSLKQRVDQRNWLRTIIDAQLSIMLGGLDNDIEQLLTQLTRAQSTSGQPSGIVEPATYDAGLQALMFCALCREIRDLENAVDEAEHAHVVDLLTQKLALPPTAVIVEIEACDNCVHVGWFVPPAPSHN